MKTKIQIKSIWGNVLFEYEKEDNTIKDTLKEAIKAKANLSGSDLSGSNLSEYRDWEIETDGIVTGKQIGRAHV